VDRFYDLVSALWAMRYSDGIIFFKFWLKECPPENVKGESGQGIQKFISRNVNILL
jgi:hypothetical protein